MIRFIELFAGIGGFRYGLESIDRNKNGRSQANQEGNFRQGLQPQEREEITNEDRRHDEQLNRDTDKRTFTYVYSKKSNLYQFAAEKPKSSELEIQQGGQWDIDAGRWHKLLPESREQYGYRCVYANEWDKYARQIYAKNFGEEPDGRDITTVGVDDIPDFDLLTGGFPCQAFSIAGKRKGFDDTRGTLFFEIARILKAKRPKYCLLENVKGLLSHDRGRTFQIILATLDELGYDLQWQVLNSKNFGVPQNRERVFIVGHLRGERRPEVFPIRGSVKEDLGQPVSTAIDSNYWKGIDNHGERTGIIMRDGRDNRNCLRSGRTPEIGYSGYSIRRLTPIECERLQGFPDNWTQTTLISDTQRYKCLGNAVTTNVITEIGKRLIENIN